MAAKKRLRSTIRKYVQAVTELAQSQVLPHRPVPSVMVKVRSCIHSSLFFGQVQNVQTCPECNGTGKVIKEKCPNCYGTGYKTVRKKFKVSIPAGIDNGQCIRMAGGGEPGTNGGERGDLLVEAVVSQHPIFKRQDTSIYSTVPISFAKAALGGPIRIKTVDVK